MMNNNYRNANGTENKNHNSRIYLVTGAAGFLGGTICRQLVERGEQVRAFVLPNDPAMKFVPQEAEVVEGDLTDGASLEKLFLGLEDSAQIHADEDLMALVWYNLLSNAIKFTEPGGTIRVAQCSDQEKVKVLVSDTGCGMDETTRKHMFDRFYQGDTSHAAEGNGLGLALVFRILQIHGFAINADSSPGEGSTFVVTIPRKYSVS